MREGCHPGISFHYTSLPRRLGLLARTIVPWHDGSLLVVITALLEKPSRTALSPGVATLHPNGAESRVFSCATGTAQFIEQSYQLIDLFILGSDPIILWLLSGSYR